MAELPALQPGDRFANRFEVRRPVGEGHRKVVYVAEDALMYREVALALLKPQALEEDPDAFEHETRVLGRVGRHENIVRLHDRDPKSEVQWMAFEFLPGGTLAEHLAAKEEQGERVPVDHLMRLARQLARALSHLHRRGIVHRDVCPSNVWLDERLGAHLGDFDTAILIDDPPLRLRPLSSSTFASPEELERGEIGPRSDLFSLGALLYTIAAGNAPRNPDSLAELRPDLPASFAVLLARLLARSSQDRPADADSVLAHLEELRRDIAGPARTRSSPSELPEPDTADLEPSAAGRASEYEVGDVVNGRFQVLGVLGEGAFSKVYRVHDDVEDVERAFKLFHSATGYEAVRRELGALRKVRHPRVVEVIWADKTDAGDWYLLTQLAEGETLERYATGEARLRDREAVDVVLDVLDALVAIHPDSTRIQQLEEKSQEGDLSDAEFRQLLELKDRGLVHRDVKPRNVVLTRTGAMLLDFNIASRVGEQVLTRSGTPAYQAPDADWTSWDVSTDLFAAGVILYQLLCDGHHPYPACQPRPDRVVMDPRKLRPELEGEMAAFLIRACAPERHQRFASAAEMREELQAIRATM